MKFWGSDKVGNYMCLCIAGSKGGWIGNNEETVYYITVETENNEVSSVYITLLNGFVTRGKREYFFVPLQD